jgi:hypothetical protein
MYLHYDPVDNSHGHFLLINTFNGYQNKKGETILCPECGKKYSYSNGHELYNHLTKVHLKEKQIQETDVKFEGYDSEHSLIKYRTTTYESVFGEPLQRNFEICYDFEAMLLQQGKIIEHRLIAYVMISTNESVFPTVKYCGEDYSKHFLTTLE